MDQVLPMILILLSTHDDGPTGLLLTQDAASGEMVVSPSDKSSQILHGILTLLKLCWGGSLMWTLDSFQGQASNFSFSS